MRRNATVSTVKKSHASMVAAWPRMNSRHDRPPRFPAGPSPDPRRSLRTVVAETLIPSWASSPTIR